MRVHSMAAGETCGGQHTIILLSWCLAVGAALPAEGSNVESPRIEAPLLEDRGTGSSSCIGGEKSVVLLFPHKGEYCQQ